jgi:hypothetical protein
LLAVTVVFSRVRAIDQAEIVCLLFEKLVSYLGSHDGMAQYEAIRCFETANLVGVLNSKKRRSKTYKVKRCVISRLFALHEETLLHGILKVVIQRGFSRNRHHRRVIRGTHSEVIQGDEKGKDEDDGSGRTLARRLQSRMNVRR